MDLNVCVNSITLLITELEGFHLCFLAQLCAEPEAKREGCYGRYFLLGDIKAILRPADTLKENAAEKFGSAH